MRFLITALIIVITSVSSMLSQRNFLSYYELAKYQQASPGAFKYGLWGYDNPALLNYARSMDMVFAFDDKNNNVQDFNRWALFMNTGPLGFGMINNNDTSGKLIQDYRLSTAFGSRAFSLGIGYGWSNGARGTYNRKNIYYIGGLYRPNEYLSVGLHFTDAIGGPDNQTVLDVAVRPIKDYLFTVYADMGLFNNQSLNNADWSAGISWEFLDGIRLNSRYFSDKSFMAGVNISLGTYGIAETSNFSNADGYDNSTFFIRLGEDDRTLLKTVSADRNYMVLNLRGSMKYQRGKFFGFFTEDVNTLMDVLQSIKWAKEDESVQGIVINTSGMAINMEMLWEIRQMLSDFKKAGKKVVVFTDRIGISDYHFATVADEIIMDPQGMLSMNGYVMGRSFYKKMFEKVGIGVQELRYFKYKSAAESFSREKMSDADKEQRQAIINDWYDIAKEDITKSRNFTGDQFDSFVNDEIYYTLDQAIGEKLIDSKGRWSNVNEVMKSVDPRFGHLVSMSSVNPWSKPIDNRWGAPPKIAVIYAIGAGSMDDGIKARTLVQYVKAAAQSSSIKAIVLRVDSPGGDAMASDYIAEVIRKYKDKKPIIVSQGFVAASGGYWLSMDADKIVSAPGTITGSIGVIGTFFYNKGLKEDLGITTDLVKVGKHADLGYPFVLPLIPIGLPDRDMTEDELKQSKATIMGLYGEFVSKVAAGRNLEKEKVEEIAQGRVWTGRAALKIGLVDEIGGLMKAIDIAKNDAGLKPDDEVQLIEMPAAGDLSLLEFLPGMLGTEFSLMNKIENNKDFMFAKFLLEHNGVPMPMMPLDYMEEIPE